MITSQNGYRVDPDRRTFVVPGAKTKFNLVDGWAGFLLVDLARYIDTHVENIDIGWTGGYAFRPIRGQSAGYSNHASGTAIDINASRHPLGKRGTWGKVKAARIRLKLRTRYGGVIRWGEDYGGRPDGMHFEINASQAQINRVATKIARTRGGLAVLRVNRGFKPKQPR